MTASVLLIGGSSPLGRAVAAALTADGATVIQTSRSGEWTHLDVRDRTAVDSLIERVRPTKVAYLASPKPAELADRVLAREMTTAFAHVVERCAQVGTESFVLASTAAVYGTAGATPWREDGPANGDSAYARFKLHSERILREAGHSEMTTTSLRFFNLYGPGFGRSLINRLVNHDEAPALQLSDHFVRDYVHADAAGTATAIALRRPGGSPDRIFNVGTGRGTSNIRLAELVADGAYVPAPEGSASYSVANPSRAEQELGLTIPNLVAEALADPVLFGIADG